MEAAIFSCAMTVKISKMASKYDYHVISRCGDKFVLKRARPAILRQNVLNIELFKKM